MKSVVTVPRQNNPTLSGGGGVRIIVTLMFLLSIFCFNSTKVFAAGPYYWIGGADTSVNVAASWSLSSGGATANHIPVAGETAIFDGGGNRNAKIDGAFSVATISITSGYTQTITQSAGVTVTTGTSYSQAGGTYTATTGTFTDNGTFALSAGTFTPPTTANTYASNFTVSGTGNYNIGSTATTTFSGSGSLTITTPGVLGGILVINKAAGGNVTIATTTSVNLGSNPTSVLGVSTVYNIINNGTILIPYGTWTTSPGSITNNGTITHNGTGWVMQQYSDLINNTGGTITYAGTAFSIGHSFTQNGTFDMTGKTVTFNYGGGTVTAPGSLGGTVVINTNTDFTVATGTIINLGASPTSTLGASTVYTLTNNGTILIPSGTWTTSPGSITNNGTITHSGNGWAIGGSSNLINNAGATITYAGTSFSVGGNFTQLGTFNLTGKTVTFNSVSSSVITANGALGGTEVISKTGYAGFTVATGTSIYLGDSPTTTINYSTSINNGTIIVNSGIWTLSNIASPGPSYFINSGTITHNGSGWAFITGNNPVHFTNNSGATITYAGTTITTTGDFTNAGTIIASAMTSISVAGNFTQSGTYTVNANATTTFNGAGAQTVTVNGVLGGKAVIDKSGGNFIVAAGTSINLGDNPASRITTGTAFAPGCCGFGILTNNGTITINSGTWTIGTYYASFINNGIINHNGSGWNLNETSFTNSASGTINYSGTSINTATGNFTQSGTFNVSTSTQIIFSGSGMTITAGTSLINYVSVLNYTSGGMIIATGTTLNLGNNPSSAFTSGTALNPGCCGAGAVYNNGTIIIPSGTWTIGSYYQTFINNGTITHSGNGLDINATDFVNNGTITYAGTAITADKSFTQNGTFDMTGKTINFDGSYNAVITANGVLGGTVLINKTGFGQNLTIATGTIINLGDSPTTHMGRNYLYNYGTINVNSGTWTLTSDNISDATYFINYGTINHNGSGWIFTTNTGSTFGFTNSAGATTTYSGSTLSFNSDFINNGVFDLTNKTITFTGWTSTTTIPAFGGSMILNKGATYILNITNSMTVVNATTTSGTLANPTSPLNLTVTGNLSIADAAKFGGPNLTVKMSNGHDQNLTVTTGSMTTPLQINKSAGYKTILQSNYIASGTAATVTVNSGALYLNGKTLSSTTTVNNGGELQIQGNEISITPILNSGSTLTYVGNGDGLPNNYYLFGASSYSNPGGTGNRVSLITATNSASTFTTGTAQNLVNGTNAHDLYFNTATVAGKYLRFDFGSSFPKLITEATWIQADTSSHGVWKFQGSNNGTDWTDIGASFTLGGATTQTITTLSNNGSYYRYYQLLGVSGSSSNSPWLYEIQFSIVGISSYPIYNLKVNMTDPSDVLILPTTLTLGGNLTYATGTISATSTTLVMSGASSTISLISTTTISSFTAGSTTASTTLNFGTTGNLVVTGTTTLQGTSTMPLTLRSTTGGQYWHFQPDGPRTFSYLDVMDSYNTSNTTINAQSYPGLVDSGRNTGWTFTIPILTVSKQGTQLSTTTPTVTNQDLGGVFTLTPTGGTFTLSSLKLKQVGSFPVSSISNIKVYYQASSYCSATKPSSATLYAATASFDTNNIATSTFSPPLTLTAGSTTCLYLTYNLSGTAGTSTMGRTVDFEITNPSTDVNVTGGTVLPATKVNINGVTMIPADNTAVIQSPPPITTTNPACSDNQIKSLMSVHVDTPALDPTLFYLQNCSVYKQEGNNTPRRLTNPNLQVQALTFQDTSGQGKTGGSVRMSITISNMDPGLEGTFMNVTRTMSTTVGVMGWSGE